MVDRADHRQEELVVGIEGTFDPEAASMLRARLAHGHTPMAIVLDFSHAREVHDLGLAMLARALAGEGVAVRFRGISQHQDRMLRYLGVDAGRIASPRDPEKRRPDAS